MKKKAGSQSKKQEIKADKNGPKNTRRERLWQKDEHEKTGREEMHNNKSE